MRYVLDCSVAVKWFVPEPFSDDARVVLERFEEGAIDLIAPETIYAEFGHALRKYVLRGTLTARESQALIEDFLALDVPTVSLRPLSSEAMRLCTAHMSTFYDAVYIALALSDDRRVLTADGPMSNAFSRLGRTLSLRDFTP